MLHRPYIRSEVRAEVEARAARNEQGQFLDANTGKPIEGKYDLGHKAGHEFRTEQALAEQEGLTQEEFNDKMNDPDLYQIEDPSMNRSHRFEASEEDNDVSSLGDEDEVQEDNDFEDSNGAEADISDAGDEYSL